MFGRAWRLIKDAVLGFVDHEAMTRGAAIACYTLFSIAPLLVLAVAIAGFFFGRDAVSEAVSAQLTGLVGEEGGKAIVEVMKGSQESSSGKGVAALVGFGILFVTASGVFAELQGALNVIWQAEAKPVSVGALVKARALSVGLVGATGFLLLVSLMVSALLSAFGSWITGFVPALEILLKAVNFVVGVGLTALLFGAIYKILPDRHLAWRDVAVGAVITAFLFSIGKTVIGWYIGGSGMTRSYGAAGALIVVLVWVYYSAQVFLLGAEFTRAWAAREGAWKGRMPARGASAPIGADAP
ncbi:YihY/virulence factor BrkB family protein [Pararoseomonas indoligenes]|uniref:YihY/virulence factor BrkB family protein n=1 Tax=Roseomonas indoligenes TaxID=2820811 RepID=A0A940S8M5_9PROT|nr:YihY/virulence factor BrkB family protein [Pararoseomonas indoligenes]MBP0494338.1 YihY/virulence factor BrkB family protein [Pararoseomonas indoligenes]